MTAQCEVCGFIYQDGDFLGLPDSWVCPVCGASKRLFKISGEQTVQDKPETKCKQEGNPLAYPSDFAKEFSQEEPYMSDIHEMALTGKTIIAPMCTQKAIVSWDDILVLGAQLNPLPLSANAGVNVRTVIGKKAAKPMIIENPVYVSHMSFGALSKEMKIALAKGSAAAKTAMSSGEGGILKEEMEAAYKYIFEYVPNLYSVTEDNLRNADAIEIKIGQGTKPGMGGHLPGEKVTAEIAEIRNKPLGQDVISPSSFEGIKTKQDLRVLVDTLRKLSGGRPIGVKIAAGHIERDLEWIAFAEPDFVTVDGRGGATGASPKHLRDAASVPTVFALSRARRYMDRHGLNMDLVITGGLRISSDYIKAISMGADAVAISSAALMAAACQQYRVCSTGECPVGCATQNSQLRQRLSIDAAAKRLKNYLNTVKSELETFCRICGHSDLKDFTTDDLCTVNREISEFTDVRHA